MLEFISLEVIVAALAVLGALLAGHLIGSSRVRGIHGEKEVLVDRLRRAENQIKESARELSRMRSERGPVADLALSLPQVIRDLNREDLEPKDVPRLILTLAYAIFQPSQMLLYSVHKKNRQSVLVLSGQRGLDDVPPELHHVDIGEGKLGWVARNPVEMTSEGWRQLNRTERVKVQDNHSVLQADIVGPIAHQGKNGNNKLLGVLSIGGLKQRPQDEKLMFQMITNFASMAIINARNMSQLRVQADQDGLTKLFNKRSFLQKLAPPQLVACESKAQPFSIFIFDIDNFKTYNDTNGHPAGDELLKQMGELILQSLSPGMIPCRYGGEEFVIAMPNTAKEPAMQWADNLRHIITEQPFEHREKQPKGFVSISGGVATSPRDGREVAVLLKRADEALYRSKEGGRNRITPVQDVQMGKLDIEPSLAADPEGDPVGEPLRS